MVLRMCIMYTQNMLTMCFEVSDAVIIYSMQLKHVPKSKAHNIVQLKQSVLMSSVVQKDW